MQATRDIAALITTAALLLVSTTANAAIYKCTVDGIELFSQQPCAPDAATVTVQEASKPSSQPAAKPQPTSTDTAATKEQVGLYIERQRIEREIRDVEAKIKAAERKLDATFANARSDKSRSANNLAGAQWETAISQEMAAAVSEYELALQINVTELDALRSALAVVEAKEVTPASGMDEIAKYNAGKERQRKADQLAREISDMQQQLKQELAALDAKVNRAKNNWAGSVWAESIRLEKQAVTSKYTNQIRLKQSEMLRLRAVE